MEFQFFIFCCYCDFSKLKLFFVPLFCSTDIVRSLQTLRLINEHKQNLKYKHQQLLMAFAEIARFYLYLEVFAVADEVKLKIPTHIWCSQRSCII